jgi:hypothetical protein
MTETFDPATRDEIRQTLADHMKVYDLTPHDIALFISKTAAIDGTISAESIKRFLDVNNPIKVGAGRVAVIAAYLEWRKESFPISAVDVFTLGMRRFFTENVEGTPVYDIYHGNATNIAGTYAFVRPCWQFINRPDLVTVSTIQIDRNKFGYTMVEQQDHPAWENEKPFQQKDVGALVALGKFLYFLIKEEGVGQTVKFGQIDSVLRNGRNHPIERFSGALFKASNHGVSPNEKFCCRRTEDARSVRQGINRLSELDDQVAKAFFSQ